MSKLIRPTLPSNFSLGDLIAYRAAIEVYEAEKGRRDAKNAAASARRQAEFWASVDAELNNDPRLSVTDACRLVKDKVKRLRAA